LANFACAGFTVSLFGEETWYLTLVHMSVGVYGHFALSIAGWSQLSRNKIVSGSYALFMGEQTMWFWSGAL
jgi:hypothetical protein